MKRDFLENELSKLGVEDKDIIKSAIDTIMSEYGKSIKENNERIEKANAENETLKNQLQEANKTIDGFKDIDIDSKDKAIEEWKEKYEQATNEFNEKMSKLTYTNKVKELASGLKFSSKGAYNDFIRELNDKNLTLENDTILGFDDFVNNYKQQDPQAFVSEQPKEEKVVVSTSGEHDKEPVEDSLLRKAMGL